jgi:predicted Zn-dependent protease
MNVSALRVVKVVAALFALMVAASVPAVADIQEAFLGNQIYQYLYGSGIIISKSPLYNDILNPITEPLKAVAGPRYDAPFIFTIGHDPYPNVASVPGGRVYVSDTTFDVIQYREELAGALCHAVAHTVRHDFASVARKAFNSQFTAGALIFGIGVGSVVSSMLNNPFSLFDPNTIQGLINAGPGIAAATSTVAGAAVAASISPLTAAEEVEREADVTGADLCAQAGLNPWGLVWLLQNYQKSKMAGRMEMLSDAPEGRVRNLEAYFASAPDRFGKFDPDRAHGTPMRSSPASAVQQQ